MEQKENDQASGGQVPTRLLKFKLLNLQPHLSMSRAAMEQKENDQAAGGQVPTRGIVTLKADLRYLYTQTQRIRMFAKIRSPIQSLCFDWLFNKNWILWGILRDRRCQWRHFA